MCSGQRRVGGLFLSVLLLRQTVELQANNLRYHQHHQQQIPLQQLSAVHITSLTAQKTYTYPESSERECVAFKKPVAVSLYDVKKKKRIKSNHLLK